MAGTCNCVNLCLSPGGPGSSNTAPLTAVMIQPIAMATALHVNSATPPSGTGEGFSSMTLVFDMTLTTGEGSRKKSQEGGREGGIEENRDGEMDGRREGYSSGMGWKRGVDGRRTRKGSGEKSKNKLILRMQTFTQPMLHTY